MADLWNIYKADGSTLGPLSSQEIRDLLRDGQVDPFDQVTRQGSNVRMDLVEVDEIFADADGLTSTKVDSVYSKPELAKRNVDEMIPNVGGNIAAPTLISTRSNNEAALQNYANVAGGGVVAPPNNIPLTDARRGAKKKLNNKKKMRRYFVQDKNKRILGPLSAGEIQSLFYRGILDKNVKVSKDKGGSSVAITQFVSAYAGERAKKLKNDKGRFDLEAVEQGRALGFPNVKVLDQMTRTNQKEAKSGRDVMTPVLSILVMLVLIGVGYYAVNHLFHIPNGKSQKPSSTNQVFNDEAGMEIQPSINQDRSKNAAAAAAAAAVAAKEQKEAARIAAVEAERRERDKANERLREQERLRDQKLQADRIAAERRLKKERKKPQAPIVQQQQSQPTPARAAPAPVAAVPKTVAVAAARPAPAPVTKAESFLEKQIGKNVSIPGMRFSKASLEQCGLKCSLSFQDSKGNRLQAIFFKGAHEDNLMNSAGTVTLKGRIGKQGDGYVIYLQSVK